MKKGRIFALVINNTNGYEKIKSRCCSSVWLECLPVTQEVASSSLVSTAKQSLSIERLFRFWSPRIFLHLHVSRVFHGTIPMVQSSEFKKIIPNS